MKKFDPTKPVNIEDLESVEEIDRLFEKLGTAGVKEMAKNYGAPELQDDESE